MLFKFALILFIVSRPLAAIEIVEIIGMEEGPRQGVMRLLEKEPQYNNVFLDCHSFLHGIYLDESFLYLSEDECYEIYFSLKEWTLAGDIGHLEIDFHFNYWSLKKHSVIK